MCHKCSISGHSVTIKPYQLQFNITNIIFLWINTPLFFLGGLELQIKTEHILANIITITYIYINKLGESELKQFHKIVSVHFHL